MAAKLASRPAGTRTGRPRTGEREEPLGDQLSIRLGSTHRAALVRLETETGLTRSEVIRRALAAYLPSGGVCRHCGARLTCCGVRWWEDDVFDNACKVGGIHEPSP